MDAGPILSYATRKEYPMKTFCIALACLLVSSAALAQNGDEPASRDDVILYLRTMRSHDLMKKTVEVQVRSMQQMLRQQIMNERGSVPADFDSRMSKMMTDLVSNMPLDDINNAMIPAYQKHFTHGDIEAMNGFYSSPVGQKVLEQLPAVMQEGMQNAMPVMSKYLNDWQQRMKKEFDTPKKATIPPSLQN